MRIDITGHILNGIKYANETSKYIINYKENI